MPILRSNAPHEPTELGPRHSSIPRRTDNMGKCCLLLHDMQQPKRWTHTGTSRHETIDRTCSSQCQSRYHRNHERSSLPILENILAFRRRGKLAKTDLTTVLGFAARRIRSKVEIGDGEILRPRNPTQECIASILSASSRFSVKCDLWCELLS